MRLAGYQTNVADWLAAATVWLLPTERENFSVAVLEALAAGCAVLSTTCPGNDEVLTDRENRGLFPVGDIPRGDCRTARTARRMARCAAGSAEAREVSRNRTPWTEWWRSTE